MFLTAARRTKTLTPKAMTGVDVCRMMKRRLKSAGLPERFSPHSFRAATVTDLLGQNVPLEDVQHLAGHADPRTTRALRPAAAEDHAERRRADLDRRADEDSRRTPRRIVQRRLPHSPAMRK